MDDMGGRELSHEAIDVIMRAMTILLGGVLDEVPNPRRAVVSQSLLNLANESLERVYGSSERGPLPTEDDRLVRLVLHTLLNHVQSS